MSNESMIDDLINDAKRTILGCSIDISNNMFDDSRLYFKIVTSAKLICESAGYEVKRKKP